MPNYFPNKVGFTRPPPPPQTTNDGCAPYFMNCHGIFHQKLGCAQPYSQHMNDFQFRFRQFFADTGVHYSEQSCNRLHIGTLCHMACDHTPYLRREEFPGTPMAWRVRSCRVAPCLSCHVASCHVVS